MAMQPATAMPGTIHAPSASAVFVTSGVVVAADAGTAATLGLETEADVLLLPPVLSSRAGGVDRHSRICSTKPPTTRELSWPSDHPPSSAVVSPPPRLLCGGDRSAAPPLPGLRAGRVGRVARRPHSEYR